MSDFRDDFERRRAESWERSAAIQKEMLAQLSRQEKPKERDVVIRLLIVGLAGNCLSNVLLLMVIWLLVERKG